MENKIEDQTSVQSDQELEPETEQIDAEPETEQFDAEPETEQFDAEHETQQFGEEAETKIVDQEPETEVTPQAQESCPSCGAPMAADQAFCTSCGAAKAAPAKKVCSKCGAELAEGQDFCPKCGQKAGLEIDAGVADAISQFNSGVSAANEAKKKQPQKIIIAVIAAIVVIAAAVFAIPKLFPSVESLCEQGRYVEAYEKADGDEAKLAVKIESVAAQSITDLTARMAEEVKAYTFDIKDVYYNEDMGTSEMFYIMGIYAEVFVDGDSIGSGRLVFGWMNNEWQFVGVVFDSESDSSLSYQEKATAIIYESAAENGTALSNEGVARVNTVIKNGVTIDPVAIPISANVTEGD